MTYKIYVIIVTYNGIKWIKKCLNSIFQSDTPLIPVIIDNNSSDSTIQSIKEHYPQITIIENKENLGFGKANNTGIQYALIHDAQYIVLLNQDAYIKPDTIQKLIYAHNKFPSYGIISPVQLNAQETLDENFSECIPQNNYDEIRHQISINNAYIETTSFVNAACWLMSVKCIQKVGAFDPIFKHYGEDRDYCNRLIYHGFKLGILFSSIVIHDREYSSDNIYRKYKNMVFSSNIARLKDINHSILLNILSIILIRFRKMIKAFFQLKFRILMYEILVLINTASKLHKVIESRNLCKKIPAVYLELPD